MFARLCLLLFWYASFPLGVYYNCEMLSGIVDTSSLMVGR